MIAQKSSFIPSSCFEKFSLPQYIKNLKKNKYSKTKMKISWNNAELFYNCMVKTIILKKKHKIFEQ